MTAEEDHRDGMKGHEDVDDLGIGANQMVATRLLDQPEPAPPRAVGIESRPAKRAFDLVLGSLMLLAFLLLCPLVMLAIKLDSPGPAVFRQWRVGRGGRLIPMYKFRSMFVDAEARLLECPEMYERWLQNDCKLPSDDDPRITRVGRLLRRSSLDELPQVLNVLAGHMSVVGPRPIEQTQLAALYHGRTNAYLSVRPGLTGLWQVSGRSRVVGDQRAQLDIDYVEAWSLGLDTRIVLKTLPAVLRADGAH